VPEPAYVGFAVGSCAVSHRHLNYLEVLLDGTEYEVEIAKRVKVAEKCPIFLNAFIILFPKHFRSAERIFERLAEDGGKRDTKELIAEKIEELFSFEDEEFTADKLPV
jgi:hypothetical protein